jgi:hypothetical protein
VRAAVGRRTSEDLGQATVEFALVLPVLVGLVLLVVQVGLVARDQVLVVHAAREAARVAAIDGDRVGAVEAARSATGLDRGRLAVAVHAGGGQVTARLHYRSSIVVPVLQLVRDEVGLTASVTMLDESSAATGWDVA